MNTQQNPEDAALYAELDRVLANDTGSPTTTDRWRAQLFVERFGPNVRFCAAWDKWLCWDETRWAVDESLRIEHLAVDFIRHLHTLAAEAKTDARRAFLADGASALESRRNRLTMIADARCLVSVHPKELDRDPWALNCLNGTLDLRTGKLRPHRRGDMVTKRVEIDFDRKAKCPRWRQFLNEIFAGA